MFELDNEDFNKVINKVSSFYGNINGSIISDSLITSSGDLVKNVASTDYGGHEEYDEDIRLMNTVFSKKLYKYLENLDLSCLIDNIVSEKISKLQDDLNLANCRVRFLEEDLKSLRSEIMSLRPEINYIKYQIESNNDV